MPTDVAFRAQERAADETSHSRWSGRVAISGVFVLAAALRIGPTLFSSGGIGGYRGYDSGVYYAASDALIHGRLPYSDFTLLHPPGLMVALTPFAAFGSLTSDVNGFAAANLAFALLGAVNAVLVLLVAQRLGFGRGPALLAGTFYATWLSAIHPEVAIRLEPLGTFAFLLALLALAGPVPDRLSGRRVFLGGVALGFAIAVKIWWIVPALLVLAWWLSHRRTRPTSRALVAGGALALLVVDGPFFVAAPTDMWRMVVLDQLGRLRGGTWSNRTSTIASLQYVWHSAGAGPANVALCVVVVAAFVLAVRVRGARLTVLVTAAQLVVLIASPSFFAYYSGYLAAGVALVIGAAAAAARNRVGYLVPLTALAGVVGVTATFLVQGAPGATFDFPTAQVAKSVEGARCVTSDDPSALIEANVLTLDLRRGCPNWVDVTGRTYDVDASSGAHYVPRGSRARWQRDLRQYLLSGQVVILMRPSTGVGPALTQRLDQLPNTRLPNGVHVYSQLPTATNATSDDAELPRPTAGQH